MRGLQPLLLVYFEDITLKQVIKLQDNLLQVQKEIDDHDIIMMMSDGLPNQREKRQYNFGCKKIDYTVNFYDMHMEYIVIPPSSNIKKCIGSCNWYHIVVANGTFHSTISALAKTVSDDNAFKRRDSIMYDETHSFPCCSPIGYKSIFSTIRYKNGHMTYLIKDGIVTDCGCR